MFPVLRFLFALRSLILILLVMVGFLNVPDASRVTEAQASSNEQVRLRYLGRHRVDFLPPTPFSLRADAGQTIFEIAVPQPPAVRGDSTAWLASGSHFVALFGIRLSGDGFVTEFRPSFDQLRTSLSLEKLHILTADSEDGDFGTIGTIGPTDALSFESNFDSSIGDILRVRVAAGSAYSVKVSQVRVIFRYNLVPQDQTLVSLQTPIPVQRVISVTVGTGASNSPSFTELDPDFGTSNAFFNHRLEFVLSWVSIGRAVPVSLLAPGGVEVFTDFYRTNRGSASFGPSGFYRFTSTNARINLLRFNARGVPIVGEWKLTINVEDSNHLGSVTNPQAPIQPAGVLTADIQAEKEVVSSQQFTFGPAGSATDSLTFPAPDYTAQKWYVSESYVHILSSCTAPGPACDAEALTVTNGVKYATLVDWGKDVLWHVYGAQATIKNPTASSHTVTLTYTVVYGADITLKLAPGAITDAVSAFDANYNSHLVSLSLGSAVPDSGVLGFTQIATVDIGLPGFNWRRGSDVRAPGGISADAASDHNAWVHEFISDPLRDLYVGALSFYGPRFVSFEPWVTFGSQAAGTWTYTALEPVTTLTFTKTGGDLLVVDPSNRRVGSDTQHVFNEIPGATYSGPGTVPEIVTIPNAVAGAYIIQVTGTSSAQYVVTTQVSQAGKAVQQTTLMGQITPGQVVQTTATLQPNTESTLQPSVFTASPVTKTMFLLTVQTDPSGLSPPPTLSPVSSTGAYDPGTVVTLFANAVTSFTFYRWLVDGGPQSAGQDKIQVTMNQAHTVIAQYAPFTMNAFFTDSDFNPITGFDVVFTSCTACKLTATNPGTYLYQLKFTNNGRPISPTVQVTIPSDFVLKGAQPIQINGAASTFTLTGGVLSVSAGTVNTGGMFTLAVHLDYALKGQTGFAGDSQTTFLRTYSFSTTANAVPAKPPTLVATGKRVTAIGGFVTDTNGVPKNGLTVAITNPSGTTTIVTTGVSGDGFYFLAVPAGGPYSVKVFNSMGAQVATQTSVQVAQDAFVQTDFNQLSPADPAIQGYARDQFGNGVKGVTVQLLDASGRIAATATTNTGGYYVFRFSRPGTYTVRIIVPTGYSATTTSVTVTVTQFQTATVNFQLTKK